MSSRGSEVDITEGLLKHVTLLYCCDCETYLQPPETRCKAELESRELLSFCIEQLKLDEGEVTLVHAQFVWTEPHTHRIMVKLRVQKEVVHGKVLQQDYIVKYAVRIQICDDCSRLQPFVAATVQLRQQVPHHQRTFFDLEKIILKHDAASLAIGIKKMDYGIDFFFSNKRHAVKFVEFVRRVAPIKSQNDRKLVSQCAKRHTCNYQYTFSVEISPICEDDLVCLPPKGAVSLGDFGPLVLCTRVSNGIMLMDPNSMRSHFLDADQYWSSPFCSLLSSSRLVEYIVLDIKNVSAEVNVSGSTYALADAQVAQVSDSGRNETVYHIRTHLLLIPGDYALGYDLYGANLNDLNLDKFRDIVLPEVILVKKRCEEKPRREHGKPCTWKLKNLDVEVDDTTRVRVHDQDKVDNEYEEFLRDLEESPELRFNIFLYLNKECQSSESDSMAI